MLAASLGALLLATAPGPVAQAERLLASARQAMATNPTRSLSDARQALSLTSEFRPAEFGPGVGRKGELLEDDFVIAREAYRRHRSQAYASCGEALARLGRSAEAARYLRRSVVLDSTADRAGLARALTASARAGEALSWLVQGGTTRVLTHDEAGAAEAAADELGLASLQAEIDRVRLAAAEVQPPLGFLDGPFRLPPQARLSTGAPVEFADQTRDTLVYLADPACRTCTADLEAVARLAGSEVRVVVWSATEDDRTLRQSLRLYRREWPVVVGPGGRALLGVEPPAAVLVSRQGWSAGVARPPFATTLPALLSIYARRDVSEARPRAAWNRQRPRRSAWSQPAMTGGGLAPGEDSPAPEEFAAAERAFENGRFSEALRLIEGLAARGDGWLMDPEARLDRALCLAGLGQSALARGILLAIGDSRFEAEVDRQLERVGSSREKGRPGPERAR